MANAELLSVFNEKNVVRAAYIVILRHCSSLNGFSMSSMKQLSNRLLLSSLNGFAMASMKQFSNSFD